MKLRSTTPVLTSFAAKAILIIAAILMMVATPIQMATVAKADDFQDRINAIQRQIDQYQAEAGKLRDKANTLQEKLNGLSNEKAQIQAQIDLYQAQYDQLQAQIKQTEQDIKDNKGALGDTIANIYVDGNISPLEMLASSKNIGDYVDKQEYQSSISDELTKAIRTIKTLKKQLETQKVDVEKVLADQKNAREALTAKEVEQQSILNQTRGEEAAYQTLSAAQQAQKEKVQQQQQAAIAAAIRAAGGGSSAVPGDPAKGNYPAKWANSDYYNPPVDDWGMYARQCVSYTAWKVFQKTGRMPYWGGRGNANQWPGNAVAAGIPTSSTPRVGSVGVIMAGQYGHVVWVEGVNSDGTINVSQYNYYNAGGSGWGHYSEMYGVSPRAYDVYIYF